MPSSDNKQIISEVKKASDLIIHFAEKSDAGSLLQCYSNSKDFFAFSMDGKMRKYQEFKNLCRGFYDSVQRQEFSTIQETFHVVDSTLVVLGWTGNINALFKNGDVMKLKDYSITNIFKKIDNEWKVIHSHESSLPPEIQKSNKKM